MSNPYEEFVIAVESYKKSTKDEQLGTLEKLKASFYLPFVETLRDNYEVNRAALLKYPYWFGPEIPRFHELEDLVFPLNDTICFIYTKKDNVFREITVNSEKETKYFFENLEDPLFICDETNRFNLSFLLDNVRASEDVAMDNHIYLYYEKPELLFCVMQTTDLFVGQDKFIFLLGEENKSLFPVDFKKKYNIDYSLMTPREIRADELKRLVFTWTVHGYSGVSYLSQITDFHPNMLTHPDATLEFYYELYESVKGQKPLDVIASFGDMPSGHYFRTDITKLISYTEKFDNPIKRDFQIKIFLNTLKKVIGDSENNSVSFWIKSIILAFNLFKNRSFKGRIVPTVLFYPHNFGPLGIPHYKPFYSAVCADFPYCNIIISIRDPISMTGSMISSKLKGKSDGQINKSMIVSWHLHKLLLPCYMHFAAEDDILYEKGILVRFEDLKLNLTATAKALAAHLDIPFSESLERTTQNGIICGNNWSGRETPSDGLDIIPVFHHIQNHDILSEYDKYRIEMMMSKYYKFFGYEPKFYDGKKYTWQQVYDMMNEPFQCDIIDIEEWGCEPEKIQKLREDSVRNWEKRYHNPIPQDPNLLPIRVLNPVPELIQTELYK